MVSEERIKEVAELFEISEQYVRFGIEVNRRGIPELVRAVRAGRVDIRHAASIARLSKPKQQHAVSEALRHSVAGQTNLNLAG